MTTPSRAEAEKIVEAWYRDTSQDVRVTYYDRDRLIDAFAAALDAARKVPEGCVRLSNSRDVPVKHEGFVGEWPSDKLMSMDVRGLTIVYVDCRTEATVH